MHLVEQIVSEQGNLPAHGLAFLVDEIEVFGKPPERLKVWATLHFLPLGSPFCCGEPLCHLCFHGERLERINEAIRHRMGLRQAVSVEFASIGVCYQAGVEFDDFSGRCASTDVRDVDRQDALGRTALMRAAVRGHLDVVEELLAAGADPSIVDHRGRSILDHVHGNFWIKALFEQAIELRRARTAHAQDNQ